MSLEDATQLVDLIRSRSTRGDRGGGAAGGDTPQVPVPPPNPGSLPVAPPNPGPGQADPLEYRPDYGLATVFDANQLERAVRNYSAHNDTWDLNRFKQHVMRISQNRNMLKRPRIAGQRISDPNTYMTPQEYLTSISKALYAPGSAGGFNSSSGDEYSDPNGESLVSEYELDQADPGWVRAMLESRGVMSDDELIAGGKRRKSRKMRRSGKMKNTKKRSHMNKHKKTNKRR